MGKLNTENTHKLQMKQFAYIFYIFIFIINSQKSQSQEADALKSHIPNITVASPQSAAISKVGEIPIDISTGRINYTIPIFEIKEGDFTMPINLSYNYSGLLLDEAPGYAGVGWTFNIGGSILHSINGLDDTNREYHKEWVYNYINKLPPYDDYLSPSGLTKINHYLELVSNGLSDGEPDKYIVNAGNLNCSFYLDKDNNPIFLNNANYKVTGYSHSGFTVTDDKGINYIFDILESSSKSSGAESSSYISSFLLREINFPTSTNKIIFEYIRNNSYSDINVSQTLTLNSTQYVANQGYEIITNKTYNITGNSKLHKIITNDYTIELQYNDHPSEPGIAVISNLSIKNKAGFAVKSYDFVYSGWTGKRSNLLNVKFNGQIINEMEYDMSTPYPVMTADSDYLKKDLWGYYNKNGRKASYAGLITPNDNPYLKPDFSSYKIGAMTKILYQTKGYSLIDYEPNTVYLKSTDYNLPYDADATVTTPVLAYTSANNGITDEETFVVTNVPAEVIINYRVANQREINQNQEQRDTKVLFLKDGDNEANAIFSFSQTWLKELTWIPQTNSFTGAIKKEIDVPGTYRIKAISGIGSTASIDVSVKQRPDYFNQTVGGLRVKQIINCDFNDHCITTTYNYSQDAKSTGVMLQRPKFYSGYHIQDNLQCRPSNYIRRDFYNFTSVLPLSIFRGSPVLYKTVEKIDCGMNQNNQSVSNGKTILSFSGQESSNSILDIQAPFLTGLPVYKAIKNSIDTLFTETKEYVDLVPTNNTKNLYILYSKNVRNKMIYLGGGLQGDCGMLYPRPLIDFQAAWFRHQPRNYILTQEISNSVFNAESLVQTTDYDYNLVTGLLKSKKVVNSKGEILEAKYFYPTDPEMTGDPFVTELISKNRVGTPLEVQNYNSSKLSDQKTVYAKDASTSNLLLPKYVYANKGADVIDIIKDKKVTYNQYDDKGNILQYTQESGSPVSIIWGYNKTQPIAKIENAAYAQVAGYVANLQTLSDGDFDNCMSNDCTEQILRNALNSLRSSFPQSMVSTYTYNPLVGVTSITDPRGNVSYYEYDSFGRLKFVKDKDLNVLQKYCYNYKGQQIDCSDNTSTSVILYKSAARSGSFMKNNCAAGGTASNVSYNQMAGAATSTISQAEADSAGLTKFNTDGQANANTNGTCTFSSIARNGSFTKNNCASGGVGSSVAFSQAAGAEISIVSQADADSKGLALFNTNGQANANTNGSCTFSSIARSGTFTKNNCASGGVGSSIAFSQAAGVQTSTVSQADADSKGLALFNTNGQANANSNGICKFMSTARSGSFTRNNCATGGTGSNIGYNQAVGAVVSNISQADADAAGLTKFNTDGQAYANANASCTFYNTAQSDTFRKNNCPAGGAGSYEVYIVPAGSYSSTTSQTAADALAQGVVNNNGQDNANSIGSCTFANTYITRTANKSNCGTGKYGSAVTYSISSATYTSTISQADADNKALTDLNNNYQSYANANGTCSAETYSAQMVDYDATLRKIWVNVTCNSSNHPARTVSVTISYKYPVNQNNSITRDVALPANSTNSTLAISLNFVGVPTILSYTVN